MSSAVPVALERLHSRMRDLEEELLAQWNRLSAQTKATDAVAHKSIRMQNGAPRYHIEDHKEVAAAIESLHETEQVEAAAEGAAAGKDLLYSPATLDSNSALLATLSGVTSSYQKANKLKSISKYPDKVRQTVEKVLGPPRQPNTVPSAVTPSLISASAGAQEALLRLQRRYSSSNRLSDEGFLAQIIADCLSSNTPVQNEQSAKPIRGRAVIGLRDWQALRPILDDAIELKATSIYKDLEAAANAVFCDGNASMSKHFLRFMSSVLHPQDHVIRRAPQSWTCTPGK